MGVVCQQCVEDKEDKELKGSFFAFVSCAQDHTLYGGPGLNDQNGIRMRYDYFV